MLILKDTDRDRMIYLLAKTEVEAHNYPKSWHGLMISNHIDTMQLLTDEEILEYYKAVFGEDNNG